MLVLITADGNKSRTISVSPVQAQSDDNEPAMRIAYQSSAEEGTLEQAIPVAARQVDDATVAIGYSTDTCCLPRSNKTDSVVTRQRASAV